jgi:ferritin-like metal-binding protein YciE
MEEGIMSLHQFMLKEMQDLYQAESEQAGTLRNLAGRARFPQLKSALEEHAMETEQQVTRLSQILEMMGENPGGSGQVPVGVQGLTSEGQQKVEAIGEPGLRDVALIAAAQKMEHYEMACYGTARAIANTLGFDEAARLLQTTLDEEEAADKRLSQVALILYKQVGQEEPVTR